MKTETFQADDELDKWIEKKSKKHGVSKSKFIKAALNTIKEGTTEIKLKGPFLGLSWGSTEIGDLKSRIKKLEEE